MAERTNGYHNGSQAEPSGAPLATAPQASTPESDALHGRRYAQIVGWGYHVPEKIITNHDLEQIVDTSDEWIRTRTGIEQRHVAADPSETTASLGVLAARKALAVADVHPSKLDLIIVSTSSPEHIFPSTASIIQDAIGATKAGAFDLSAACSGFVYALAMARGHILAGDAEYVMVIGAETLSRIVDWTATRAFSSATVRAPSCWPLATCPAASWPWIWAATAPALNCSPCPRAAAACPPAWKR
jgi:hypothetical protein